MMRGAGRCSYFVLMESSQIRRAAVVVFHRPTETPGGCGDADRPGAARNRRHAGTKTISGAYCLFAGSEDAWVLLSPKRPVVLIVEDEFLLRMDAVDMIAAAGFEVGRSRQCRPGDRNSGSPPGHHGGLHRYPDAGFDGRVEARPGGQGPLAADQDCRDLRPRPCRGNAICPKADGFCPSPTVRPRSTACCGR